MEYDNRIVAFIDILGFEGILAKTQYRSIDNELLDNPDYIVHLHNVFLRIRDLLGVEEQLEGVAVSRRVTQFSDSIVISFEISDEPIEFIYLLGEFLHLTYELLKSKILIRGGISHGAMIHTEKVLFGPALVRAYFAESKAAVSPRIVLPQSLYDKDSEYRVQLGNISNSGMELNDLIEKDEDDFYYLDYFDKCQKPELGIFASDDEYIEHIIRLKEIIIEGLKTTKPGLYSKYGWMKTKWNRTVINCKSSLKQDSYNTNGRQDLASFFLSQSLIETSM